MAVNIYNQVPFNTYTPRSFQEMLAPVMYAAEEESKLQQQYADTGSTIDKAMAYLNPELDKESYAKIQQYKADLSKAVDDLSTKGFVDSGRKANLYKLKQRYDTDFASTALQIEQRNAAAMMQAQMAQKDPSYVYKPASAISIDEGLKNPNIWTDLVAKGGISGESLKQQTAQQAKVIKDAIITIDPKLQSMVAPNNKPILDQYIQRIVKGASPTEIYSAISGVVDDPSKASAITTQLMSIVDNVMTANNVESLFSPDTQEYTALKSRAAQGLFEAAGGVDFRNITDQMSMEQRRAAIDLANFKEKKRIEAADERQENALNLPPIDGLFFITSPTEVNPGMKKVVDRENELSSVTEFLLQEIKGGNAAKPFDTTPAKSEKWSDKKPGLAKYFEKSVDDAARESNAKSIQQIWSSKLSNYGISTKGKSYAQLLKEVHDAQDKVAQEKSKMIIGGKDYSPRNSAGIESFVNFALEKDGAVKELSNGKISKNSISSESGHKAYLPKGVLNINFLNDNPIVLSKDGKQYVIDIAKIDVPLAGKIQKVSMDFQNLYKKLDNPNVKLNPDDLLQITNPNVNWEFDTYPGRREVLQEFWQLQIDRNLALTNIHNFMLGESEQVKQQ